MLVDSTRSYGEHKAKTPPYMPNAQQLRAQIESQLAHRIPSALTPTARLIRETIPTGIQPIDEMLGGGLPLGAISEVIGEPSSGRTTFALSVLAHVTRSGQAAAWVDASDEFDTVSSARAGVVLSQLLLVRCGVNPEPAPKLHHADTVASTRKSHGHDEKPATGGGSHHPRTEAHGLGKAVGELFHLRLSNGSVKAGTPSAANMRFGKVPRSEQVNSDRMPPRRAGYTSTPGTAVLHDSSRHTRSAAEYTRSFEPARAGMEQALKVIDLVLQNGGFRTVVMDFAGFAPERVSMIPLATWFRFRALAESTNASLLLLTQHPCAKSSASVSLRLENIQVLDNAQVLTAMAYRALLLKQPSQTHDPTGPARKPPQAVKWHARCAWAAQ